MSEDLDYRRIYQYRHRNVDPATRHAVWGRLALLLSRRFGAPERVLDPAASAGEFIAAVAARER